MSAVSCPKCSRLVTLPEGDHAQAWVRCPLCSEEYALQEAIDALPPLLQIIPSPITDPTSAVPSKIATKVHPPMLPPVATESTLTIPSAVSFQTDINQEAIETPPRELPQLVESFDRPAMHGAASANPPVSVRPPALPTSTSGPPPRPAPTFISPTSVTAVAQPTATQTAAASTADEAWMSQPIGSQSDRSRRRRKSNPLKEFLKIVIGGIVGLALGNAVLFWGLKIDLFNMAKRLPAFMVPEQLAPKGDPSTGLFHAHS